MLVSCDSQTDSERLLGEDIFVDISRGAQSVCGVLRVDAIEPAQETSITHAELLQTTNFVRGRNYFAMEDNDIRGFLDGYYKFGWNQVSQVHLRLGRRGRSPKFGEYEIFRNLQRWDQVSIPNHTKIKSAQIELSLESGPPFGVDVAVYSVNKDWNPGSGGIQKNNNSAPATGEVWWGDAGFQTTPWSKPGAGYASDSDLGADTGGQPLAIARYDPGDQELVFASTRFTDYVKSRVTSKDPILLLYKLVDVHEDSPGSVLQIWSANYGPSRSGARRPRLTLQWYPESPVTIQSYPIVLEHGRALEFSNIGVGNDPSLAISFVADPGLADSMSSGRCGQTPFIEYRVSDSADKFRAVTGPLVVRGDRIDLRVTAASDPVTIGTSFSATIRDTWVTSGDPETMTVEWVFTSPDGRRIKRIAKYLGDYSWRVQFDPDVLGRWQYRWRHKLAEKPFESEELAFDVVALEKRSVSMALDTLQNAIIDSELTPGSIGMLPFELAFARLERVCLTVFSVEELESDSSVKTKLKQIRKLLSGADLPDRPIL